MHYHTWHLSIGWSLMASSLSGLNVTDTVCDFSPGTSILLTGWTINHFEYKGPSGLASNEKLQKIKKQTIINAENIIIIKHKNEFTSTCTVVSKQMANSKTFFACFLTHKWQIAYLYAISYLPLFLTCIVSLSSSCTLRQPKSSPPSVPAKHTPWNVYMLQASHN